ncbi:AER273Cp [Eremothecium gossypii ATCC 10895]|uniref:AER273Cp n=1 Tax=Eremothecium gossypii (strain ATCC 10895 / CBS 109.51 / FGSC 9923 / NRRL Y-1056) TaxID=284811 RepID=Q756I8_EREGS|nr:AER273Cp [Eremothecium gossypii ATCC 10895]AAS52954.2 AER273Cp [Eremothecium gossypii ATCC 10895]
MTVMDASQCKEWLIEFKVRKGAEVDKDAVANFERRFEAMFAALVDEQIDEPTRLLLTDAMGVWMIRCRQAVRAGWMQDPAERLLTLERATTLFRYVIDFWSGGGAPLANSLRQMFEKMMQLLAEVHGDAAEGVFSEWLREALTLSPSMRFVYFMVDVLSERIDLGIVLEVRPEFIATALGYMWSDSLATAVGKSVTSLLANIYVRHYTEDKLEMWLQLWEQQVVQHLLEGTCAKRVQLYVLEPLFRTVPPKVFDLFILRNMQGHPALLLPLLKIGQELGIEEEPFHEDKLIMLSTLESLLRIDKYKLGAFEVLTYSHKGSRPVRGYVLDILRNNLQIFFVDFDIETRNYFHSAFKRFIARIRDAAYSLNRDAAKLKLKNKFEHEQLEKLAEVENYRSFLEQLLSYLLLQIAPGSQYQRSSLAYKLINTLISSGLDSSVSEKFLDIKRRTNYPFNISIFEPCMIRLLCDNLSNDYDDIRQWSLDLLAIAFESTKVDDHRQLVDSGQLKTNAFHLLNFYKGSNGGSKVMEFLFLISDDKTAFIKELIEVLDRNLSFIEVDPKHGLENPVSGLFASLDLLFARYDFSMSSEPLVSKCIALIIRNWNGVKDVLCHDSPEGNLPLKYANAGISDQTITSYAFRSIKESGALLSTLLLKAPMTKEELVECGEILICQLSTIRHSGTFQSVIPSFTACCRRCMEDVPEQMEEWLNESIKSLQTKTQYITRRSGGLPFLVSCILSAENDRTRPWLKRAYAALSDIARIPILEHEDKLDLPQVNAFNCIRSLFINSMLSEACAPYVYPALELCLENFTSPLWSMRNCSFMLFTALQNRLFGKIGKNTSARLFFTRYKGIREILLKKLQDSVDITSRPTTSRSFTSSNTSLVALSEQAEIESIFLVLATLSRLKPTPGYNGLDDFQLEILKSLENRNWKIREMAARALPALMNDPYAMCFKLLNDRKCNTKHQNRLHGHLLAVKELITSERNRIEGRPLDENLTRLILQRTNLYVGCNNPCNVTAKAYVELIELVFKHSSESTCELKEKVTRFLSEVFVAENAEYKLDGSLQLLLAKLIDLLLKHDDPKCIPDILLNGLYSPFFEVQLATLQYIDEQQSDVSYSPELRTKLAEMLVSDTVVPMVKSKVLNVLKVSGNVVDSSILFSLLEDRASDSMKANALSLLGSNCGEDDDDRLWNYIEEYSRDDMPQHYRAASLRCLINCSSIAGSEGPRARKFLYGIYKALWDDDVEIRNAASLYLNKNYLASPPLLWSTNPSVTADLFIEKLAGEAGPEEVLSLLGDFFKSKALRFDFRTSAATSICQDLFAVEEDNQYRNPLSFASASIRLLRNSRAAPNDVVPFIQPLVDRFLAEARFCTDRDDNLCYFSDPVLFSAVVILRSLVNTYTPSQLEKIDTTLLSLSFHPLISRLLL